MVVVKDSVLDESLCLQILSEVNVLKSSGHLRLANMSRGDDQWADEYFRGDSLSWITPSLIEELSLVGIPQLKDKLIAAVQSISCQLGLVDTEHQMQFAVYPGKGEGYNRHRDAFAPTGDRSSTSRQ